MTQGVDVRLKKADLLLEIAVRIAYLLQLDPSLCEDEVIATARQLVAALRAQ